MTANTQPARPRGFTLIEILVVIGIIVILLSILIPVAGRVRTASRVAAVQAQINALDGAIAQYHQDHGAYPGPLSDDDLRRTGLTTIVTASPAPSGFISAFGPPEPYRITGTENLVLGLLGGLKLQGAAAPFAIAYDPSLVGTGASNLNPGDPKKFRAYIEPTNLSWRLQGGNKTGRFQDGGGAQAFDTIIPEIVDVWPTPMPVLYLRARKGWRGATTAPPYSATDNPVVTNVPSPGPNPGDPKRGHYDYAQFSGYTTNDDPGGRYIGEGKTIRASDYVNPQTTPAGGNLPHGLTPPLVSNSQNSTLDKSAAPPKVYEYPYNSFAYLRDPASSDNAPQPRRKDTYILISAGADRVYGTADDITNFGAVAP